MQGINESNDLRPLDSKGRPNPVNMSDREMMAEILITMRGTKDALDEFAQTMKTNPMLKMFAGKLGG